MSDAAHATMAEADGVLTVTLDRQDKLNAISPEITATLWEAVEAMATRDDLRVLVIQAVGRYFTAGIDVGGLERDAVVTGQSTRRTYRRHHLLYDEFEALEKPIILAAQGPCLGAGLEMAGSCDFRFAAPEAKFRLPEIDLAVIAGSGGTSRITRLVGPHWGKWLAMAGQPVDAERALMIGLVHDIYPAEGFHDRVHDFAKGLAALPPEALGVAKLAVDLCDNVDPTTARHIERIANTPLMLGQEHAGRVKYFNERAAERAAKRG